MLGSLLQPLGPQLKVSLGDQRLMLHFFFYYKVGGLVVNQQCAQNYVEFNLQLLCGKPLRLLHLCYKDEEEQVGVGSRKDKMSNVTPLLSFLL